MFNMKSMYAIMAGCLMALTGMLLMEPAHAEYPIPAYTSGQPADGRHVNQHNVAVTTNAAVGVSTNTIRMHISCQFTNEGTSSSRLYWDTVLASTNTKWVSVGQYFTPDIPIAWQGQISFKMSTSTGQVVCSEYEVPEEWQ